MSGISVRHDRSSTVVSTYTAQLLYSYSTLVAAHISGRYYVVDNGYSATTGRHVAGFVGAMRREYKKRGDIQLVSQAELNDMFSLIRLPKDWEDTLVELRIIANRTDEFNPELQNGLHALERALAGRDTPRTSEPKETG